MKLKEMVVKVRVRLSLWSAIKLRIAGMLSIQEELLRLKTIGVDAAKYGYDSNVCKCKCYDNCSRNQDVFG